MKTLAQIKALFKLLTGKDSTAKTTAGVLKDLNDNLVVEIDADTNVLTISVKDE
jgi:hypothetical protein